jgi:N-acylglucosamine 2-epimerase
MNSIFPELQSQYRKTLTESILPFWLKHGLDMVNGGLYTGLDRDGSLLETDKAVWFQGRALWTYATAYLEVEQRPEYLEACTNLVGFIDSCCFDDDGRMFFRVAADGRPVIKRLRYFFSETFTIIGWAAYARAARAAGTTRTAGARMYAEKALELFKRILTYRDAPGILLPKFNPETSPSRGFGVPMILLNTAQELRKTLPEERSFLNQIIDQLIGEIERYFVNDELQLVLEQCAPDGSLLADHFEGRLLNPGHAIEGSWFILNEARYRDSDRLKKLGLKMLDWMWEIGWDAEYGGIWYFRDALGKSPTEYWHDMKFWWPQNEAAIANLLAYRLTGEQRYLDRFTLVHEYVHAHFPDTEMGEWYGYLHRDGSLSTPLKGNIYKGPFHIPRMYLVCLRILEGV